MKKLLGVLFTAMLLIGVAGNAGANTITITDAITTRAEVDQWFISLSNETDLSINVLADEDLGENFFNNGAGNDRLDSVIYLFSDAGIEIDSNDDNLPLTTAGLSDGSISSYDSYMLINNLPAGDYILAIGDCFLSSEDAWNGINAGEAYDSFLGSYMLTLTAGDDVLSLTGTNDPVPEPATMFLLGAGLLGLVGLRKRFIK